ncbi:IclR family transcriptional regulator [Roseovarius gahaiensis]|uniref:IclR family transcriptional regulator n=1 Tax=Roseovarius gahaiensis TaxID=2716691 RepID=A0A967BF97_9RHOB|nr:IclR family transcriptional regulator [Roseovarius gahaiensis]NHQ75314.1 IclR family transcriptional regulator [Roseovarius gahaiensis]
MTLTGSQSVDRAFDLLHIVGGCGDDGASLQALVERSELTRPTVYRLISALIRASLVERDAVTDRFHLGEGASALGLIAESRHGVHTLARDSTLRLAADSEDTAFFGARRGSWSLCLLREEGRFPIRSHILAAGQRYPLGVGAHGIALLAALEDWEVDIVLSETEAAHAKHYPALTRPLLRDLIEETRAVGWALNRGLIHENAWAMGRVVTDNENRVVGALSIGAMKDRFSHSRQSELAELLSREAERISAQLQIRKDRTHSPRNEKS